MNESKQIIVLYDYSAVGFERVHAKLDALHDLASEGRLAEATSLRASDIIGWLEDIIFTAEETIREIDAHTLDVTAFAALHARVADANQPAAR
ncbi:MAG: hypothetical protein HY327_12545 [Chloroflexi bacterium]|nr:hypothetical protein [Chloroflexota bacterium]